MSFVGTFVQKYHATQNVWPEMMAAFALACWDYIALPALTMDEGCYYQSNDCKYDC